MFLIFHFLHCNFPDIKCYKQKWGMLFFTLIKLVAHVLAWKRLHSIYWFVKFNNLLLPITSTLLLNIFCNIYCGFVAHLNNLLMLTTLLSILFLMFSIVLPYIAVFINLYNTFSPLSPLLSTSIHFLCQIQHTVLAILTDWILIHNAFY